MHMFQTQVTLQMARTTLYAAWLVTGGITEGDCFLLMTIDQVLSLNTSEDYAHQRLT